ncbi:2137_t:CDS:1 [Ambispora gerdemannii]|uniref:2137_t:CDS:1 n=1 Tax=Ambispora gerdemannii TaxID=144530 RepID=A0A9N9H4U6_9GLOM|nr:2137_t:CDS:1 [Ambispora gerdemannii]
MKPVLITLTEQEIPGQPNHKFDAEWCLDLHGFLSRDEFTARLKEINNYIRDYPLLSERAKTFIKYACGGMGLIVALLILVTISAFQMGVIIEICLFIGYFIAKLVIENIARGRAERFTIALNKLLKQYNEKENPTANWNLVWRSVVTHYTITTHSSWNGRVKGEATPVYAEYAEIVLEIHDALSDLTAKTVRVNLAPDIVSVPYTLPQSHGPSVVNSPHMTVVDAGTSV